MSRTCKTSKELGEAIRDNENYIEIEGDLAKKVIRIKATGAVAWGVCVAALGPAITLGIVAVLKKETHSGSMSFVSGIAAMAIVIPILGPAATTAVAIGVAAGGVGALNTLRDRYKVIEKEDGHMILQRK